MTLRAEQNELAPEPLQALAAPVRTDTTFESAKLRSAASLVRHAVPAWAVRSGRGRSGLRLEVGKVAAESVRGSGHAAG